MLTWDLIRPWRQTRAALRYNDDYNLDKEWNIFSSTYGVSMIILDSKNNAPRHVFTADIIKYNVQIRRKARCRKAGQWAQGPGSALAHWALGKHEQYCSCKRVLPYTPNQLWLTHWDLRIVLLALEVQNDVNKCVLLMICPLARCQYEKKAAASFPLPHNSPIVQAGPQGPKLRLFHGHAGLRYGARFGNNSFVSDSLFTHAPKPGFFMIKLPFHT